MTCAERKVHAAQLALLANRLGLGGAEILVPYGAEELASLYNGIGPDFLPEPVRAKVTEYLALFEAAALIHDVRYSLGDATRYQFNYANMEFRNNCRKLAEVYPWYNWRRYRAYAVAEALYKAVSSDLGWTAFCTASANATSNITKTTKE